MKKILSICTAILICTSLFMPAMAAGANNTSAPRIIDHADFLTDAEEAALETEIQNIIENYGFDVVFMLMDNCGGEDVYDFTVNHYTDNNHGVGEDKSGIVLLMTEAEAMWSFYADGKGIELFTQDVTQPIIDNTLDLYDNVSHFEAVDYFLDAVTQKLVQANIQGEGRTDSHTYYLESIPRIVDNKDLLTPEQEADLNAKILNIIQTYNFDVVFVTQSDIGSKSTMEYSDDFFDYGGYGVGEDFSGVLVLISDSGRWISGCGSGTYFFDSNSISTVGKQIAPLFDEGDAYGGFTKFLEYTNSTLNSKSSSYYKSIGKTELDPVEPTPVADAILALMFNNVALAIVALVIVKSLEKKMNTARKQSFATEYVKRDSFKLTRESDKLLYKNTTSRKIESSSSGGGGGGSHSSSSGRSHSGGSF